MKRRLLATLFLVSTVNYTTYASDADKALPSTITIAMQPSQSGSQRSGPLNSVLLKTLLKTPAKVNIYLCPWARCLKAIETGTADIVDDLYYTEQRDSYIHFLQPQYDQHDAYFRFYTLAGRENEITQWSDLYGKGIGTIRANVHFDKFDRDANLNKYQSVHISDSINLLLNQRIDVIIGPPTLTRAIIDEFDPTNRVRQTPYKVAVSKPVFIGVSRQSAWNSHIDVLERALTDVLAE